MFTLIDPVADDCVEFTPAPARDTSSSRRLGRAFVAATHGGFSNALDELHAAVDAFVEPRRIAGEPPEKVIIAVKNALRMYGGLQELAPPATDARTERNEVYDRLFQWTVNSYYGDR